MIGKAQHVATPALPGLGGIWQALGRHRLLAALGVFLLLLAGLGGVLAGLRSAARPVYQTQPVVRQDLTKSVTASGTVNPQDTVNVGTQVSGTVEAIYVDFNSHVRKGEVLARLDTSQLQAQLDQAQANLAQAQAQASAQSQNANASQANVGGVAAGIETAQANLAKSQSALKVANETLARDKTLLSKGYIAQSQYDVDASSQVAAQTAVQAAQAALTQARAQTSSSSSQADAAADTAQAGQASIAAAQAQVQQDQLNIDRAVITSPVDGTVIARDVSVGQTVAASFQTPTLFSIAQDLHKMEVDINVGEPDIGNVRPGDNVSFSVLAYPNETFNGTVSQVRVNPTTVNNVVTYDVITLVDNAQNKLLPGMTANASIAVQTAKNALVVPTQALSFRPQLSGAHRPQSGASAAASPGSPWGQTAAGAAGASTPGSTGLIFVEKNGKPSPVRVRIDLVSGAQAAVTPLRGTLNAGDSVILSSGGTTQTRTAYAQRSANPMAGMGRVMH